MSRESRSISFDDTQVAFAAKSDRELQKASWLFRMMGNSAACHGVPFAVPLNPSPAALRA